MKRTLKALKTLTGLVVLATVFRAAYAQSPRMESSQASLAAANPSASLAFGLADVHASVDSKASYMNGGWLQDDRFIVHHATLVELIAKAYGFQIRKIRGGPSWLDTSRYDITAQAPPDTSDDDVKQMLRALLADRFKLVLHTENRAVPAYLITAPNGGSGMKQSSSPSPSGCKSQQPADATPPPGTPSTFSCHAESMSAFADFLYTLMWNPNQREIDATGLTGLWDFNFKVLYPPRVALDTTNNFKALERDLRLKVVDGTAPLPVLVIDSALRTPTPNPPGVAALLPPPPPTKFDVVTIKSSSPDSKELMGDMGNGKIDLTGATLQFLIAAAWDLDPSMIANPPEWLNHDRFDIAAKLTQPDPASNTASPPRLSDADFQHLIRRLLEDHFEMKWHMEDRPTDAYALLAVNPKLRSAAPGFHSDCVEGPGPDGRDPRNAQPILGRLISCQNLTMARLAEELPVRSTGYIKLPVFDATGLAGAYDFVLSFSGYSQVGGVNEWSKSTSTPGAHAPTHLVVPPGGLLMLDAIQQQLGLKLEKQKHPVPMLIIDHINEKTTEQ